MKAFDITGTIENAERLKLDKPIPIPLNEKVRLIVLVADNGDEISELEWLKAASSNPAFEFLNNANEDIYSPNDGQPFNDKR